ncbi:carbon-nitrogen hydrolase family protein [Rhizobiales bacterium]|uniref:carbon-nitrogen hydrolase family protein n=1 Tax=Hongsoonwoonella zoysiae TaxID=2821844 RepID=UPI0015616805|nr:carbon-nitrogen hydrolase family protein [Hongsoonwoonella zoysiae]NRG17183.1 carbon-nitrogen hydrolase family protein [Hongsoonwoonella zoysiae]
MTSFVAAAVQLRTGRDIAANVEAASDIIREAAKNGADYIQTPEMTHLLEASKPSLMEKVRPEEEDLGVRSFSALARDLGVFLHIGSLAIKAGETALANRAFLFAPDGAILARYDKIHMFDVDLPNGESWRESATYRPGRQSAVVDLPWLKLGMAVCYDVRFPAIFRTQARAGAQMLSAPAAFTRQTGIAHWHVLQRARAIENGAFLVSAAQGGKHEDGRETYGHSLIVAPWGEIIGERDNDEPGFVMAEIDPAKVEEARKRIPAIANEQAFELAEVTVPTEALT